MPLHTKLSNILIVEDSKGRREIVLDGSVYSIGRDPKCDIRLSSQFVSRHHATLVQLPKDDDTFYYRIVDGNLKGKPSANGMLINGRKLQAHDLKNEDEIVFGPKLAPSTTSSSAIASRLCPPTSLISPSLAQTWLKRAMRSRIVWTMTPRSSTSPWGT